MTPQEKLRLENEYACAVAGAVLLVVGPQNMNRILKPISEDLPKKETLAQVRATLLDWAKEEIAREAPDANVRGM